MSVVAAALCSKACKEMRESRVFFSRHFLCCLCAIIASSVITVSLLDMTILVAIPGLPSCLPSQFYLHVSFSVFKIDF